MQQFHQEASIAFKRLSGFHHIGMIIIEICILQVFVRTQETASRGKLPRVLRFCAKHRHQRCVYGVAWGRRSVNCRNDDRIGICKVDATRIHHNRFNLSGALYHCGCRGEKYGRSAAGRAGTRTHVRNRIIPPEFLHFRICRGHRNRRRHHISCARRGQRDGINAAISDSRPLNHRLDRCGGKRRKGTCRDGCRYGRICYEGSIVRDGLNDYIFTRSGKFYMRAHSKRPCEICSNTCDDGAVRRCRYCV